MITAARLSTGYAIGLPIAVLVVVACIVGAVGCWGRVRQHGFKDEYGWTGWGVASVILTTVSGLLLIGLPWAFFPWSMQYHEWVTKSGTVSVVGNKFTDGQGTSDTSGSVWGDFVVQFNGDPTRFDCLDTRCALARVGDHLTMSCIRDFQWSGVPGWRCNFTRDEQ